MVGNGVSNIIHEFRHGLNILVASHVAYALFMVGYISELGFDSFQGTRRD